MSSAGVAAPYTHSLDKCDVQDKAKLADLPIPQFDIFDRMDIALLSQAQTSGLPPFWEQVVAEREKWVKEPPP